MAGVGFDERWPRFDGAVRALRAHLSDDGLQPVSPARPPIWIGSGGSAAGLRRVARLGDGWRASAYNTSPEQVAVARVRLGAALGQAGKTLDGLDCALATMWTYVTDSAQAREAHLSMLGRMLGRPVDQLRERVLVGAAPDCGATLRAYLEAGIDHVFVWPVADPHDQLERFMRDVVPLVTRPGAAASHPPES